MRGLSLGLSRQEKRPYDLGMTLRGAVTLSFT